MTWAGRAPSRHRLAGDGEVLVILQTQDAQEKIAAFLGELRAAIESAAGGKENHDPLYVPRRGPAEQKIEAALNGPADVTFKKAPLTDVVRCLADRYKIEVRLDRKALSEAGIGTDTAVTKHVKGTTLKAALRLMLHEFGLAYVIEDEVLLITTTEAAEQREITVIYPVADLVVTGRDENGRDITDFESLMDLIYSTVDPTTWPDVGGPMPLSHFSVGKAHFLVIPQMQEVHEDIAAMLTGLREAKRAMAQGKDPNSPIYVPRRSPAVEKIEARLDSPAELTFKKTPLTARSIL